MNQRKLRKKAKINLKNAREPLVTALIFMQFLKISYLKVVSEKLYLSEAMIINFSFLPKPFSTPKSFQPISTDAHRRTHTNTHTDTTHTRNQKRTPYIGHLFLTTLRMCDFNKQKITWGYDRKCSVHRVHTSTHVTQKLHNLEK